MTNSIRPRSMLKKPLGWSFGSSLLIVAGCGGDTIEVEEKLGTAVAELTSTLACRAIRELDSIELDNLTDEAPVQVGLGTSCDGTTFTNTSYLGSKDTTAFAKSVSKLEGDALYCALKGAHGARADGTEDLGILGRFGVESRLRIHSANGATRTLAGDRIGKLYAFGVGMDIETQDFEFSAPTERQPARFVTIPVAGPGGTWGTGSSWLPEQTGQYAHFNTSYYNWGIDADATFDDLMGLRLSLSYAHRGDVSAGNRQAYHWTLNGRTSNVMATQKARVKSWNDYVAQCEACLAIPPVCGPATCVSATCDCPTRLEQVQQARSCGPTGCTPEYYANLTDGNLPHENALGASGPFMDRAGKDNDFWYIGVPGPNSSLSPLQRAAGETLLTIDAEDTYSKTTKLSAGFGYAWELGVVDVSLGINLDALYRDGAALRQYHDGSGELAAANVSRVTEVGLDAETKYSVGTHVKVKVPIWGTVVNARKTIISSESAQSGVSVPSRVRWNEVANGEGAVLGYSAVGTSASDLNSCLTAPSVTGTPTEVSNPVVFIETVKDKAVEKLFPCHMEICVPTGTRANPNPTLHTCSWDPAEKEPVCTDTGRSCRCTDSKVEMCDAAGNVYPTAASPTDVATGCPEPR